LDLTAKNIQNHLRRLGDPAIAQHSQRFFKTGPGQYGEGDRFLGIRVPVLRKLVKTYLAVSYPEIVALLTSPYHEARLLALLLLVHRFQHGAEAERTAAYGIYLGHTRHINNWDLVDSSAPHIVGAYLADKDKDPLYELTASENLWERRIAILATLHDIRNRRFDHALEISRRLLTDRQDLIHKAVGWMLREIGKRDPAVEKAFLKRHYRRMPRTMLRYAIEKFPPAERRRYLQGRI
jgi:3-methyladenine DNA glycosylase AlkD